MTLIHSRFQVSSVVTGHFYSDRTFKSALRVLDRLLRENPEIPRGWIFDAMAHYSTCELWRIHIDIKGFTRVSEMKIKARSKKEAISDV